MVNWDLSPTNCMLTHANSSKTVEKKVSALTWKPRKIKRRHNNLKHSYVIIITGSTSWYDLVMIYLSQFSYNGLLAQKNLTKVDAYAHTAKQVTAIPLLFLKNRWAKNKDPEARGASQFQLPDLTAYHDEMSTKMCLQTNDTIPQMI